MRSIHPGGAVCHGNNPDALSSIRYGANLHEEPPFCTCALSRVVSGKRIISESLVFFPDVVKSREPLARRTPRVMWRNSSVVIPTASSGLPTTIQSSMQVLFRGWTFEFGRDQTQSFERLAAYTSVDAALAAEDTTLEDCYKVESASTIDIEGSINTPAYCRCRPQG